MPNLITYMSNTVIEGIKLIKHNMGGVNNPDDPAYGPWRLDASFRVPSFMEVAASFIYGREEIVIRGKTKEALEQFADLNGLKTHPRLQKLEITQPEVIEPADSAGTPKQLVGRDTGKNCIVGRNCGISYGGLSETNLCDQ